MSKGVCRAVLLFLMVTLLSAVGIAEKDQNGAPIFNQRVMDELKAQGHKWDDLVEASKLTYKYNLALETILQLRHEDVEWKEVDQALQHLKQVKNDFTKKKISDPILLSLVNEGFTEDQIALLAYYANIRDESMEMVAEKTKKTKKENRLLDGVTELFAVELESVDPGYTADATSTATDWQWGAGYDADKSAPFATVISNQNETLNPATGSLMVTATDLRLPGRNGLDFELKRVYRSEKSELQTFGHIL